MEFRADVLPADGDQYLALGVENGAEDAGDLVEVVHHRLDDRRVDDVLQLQQFDVALGREDGVELALHARFALAQRLGPLLHLLFEAGIQARQFSHGLLLL